MGLAFGTIPFLLHKHSSYTQIGLFYFSGYPYSLKLLWSPFVDSYYFRSFGRRKSWIVPIQLIAGFMFLVCSYFIDDLIEHSQNNIATITIIFIIFIFLAATQDIAVDGWALTILPKQYLHYASTCQTIGLNTGLFLSYTLFLGLSSPSFANNFIRSQPSDEGLITLPGYFFFWGAVFIVFSIYLALFKEEESSLAQQQRQSMSLKDKDSDSEDQINSDSDTTGLSSYGDDELQLAPQQVYKLLWKIITLPHIKTLAYLFIVAKIVFQSNESALSLKLLDKGLKKEDVAAFSLIQFPCIIIFSIFSGRWIKDKPLTVWVYAYLFGVIFVFFNMLSVYFFPADFGWGYSFVILVLSLSSSFTYNLMLNAQGSFFLKISDKQIGGTYVTLLNTIANFAGTYPKFFILMLIDQFTSSRCIISSSTTTTTLSNSLSQDIINNNSTIVLENVTTKDLCSEKKGEFLVDKNDSHRKN
eukprot:gene4246-5315_t